VALLRFKRDVAPLSSRFMNFDVISSVIFELTLAKAHRVYDFFSPKRNTRFRGFVKCQFVNLKHF
jgi:hypothetical protein